MKKISDIKQCEQLIEKYVNSNGEYLQINEGVLGLGIILLYDFSKKLKCFVIKEYYLNEWSSEHLIMIYKNYDKLPKKYKKLIEY